MDAIIKILTFYNGQYNLTDLFNKNLNINLQKDIIQSLANQFISN